MLAIPSRGPLRWRLLVATLSVAVLALFALPPSGWLPPAGEAGNVLGNLLTAQAALVALMLAISLFLLQGVKQDAGDRMYREYVRVLHARPVFRASLAMLALTGATVVAEGAIADSAGAGLFRAVPGLAGSRPRRRPVVRREHRLGPDPVRAGASSCRPGLAAWGGARENERDARNAVLAFLIRRERALSGPDRDLAAALAAWRHDPGEDQADVAIRALLGDALRAMDESREDEFAHALDSIRHLVEYAMDEVERRAIGWEAPGARPQWPPLRELPHALYPFREAVIRRGDREYAFGLLNLDYWLLANGVRRRCGELFTVGLKFSATITRSRPAAAATTISATSSAAGSG